MILQRSPSTSSSSSSSSNSSSCSSSCTKCNSDDSKNKETEECNEDPDNIISLNEEDLYVQSLENKTKESRVSTVTVNNNTKDETEKESNLQIETETKTMKLTNINAENEEDEDEKDFSSDDSVADPNYQIENNDFSSDENKEENISRELNQNITRKRKAQPKLWKTNVAKRLRNAGKEYVGKNNKVIRERRLGPGCTEKCKLKCNTKFDNETRRHIFEEYYKLPDLQSKRTFVALNMSSIAPKYQYKKGQRRNNNAFYMRDKDGEKIRVCKSFFMSTLDVSDRFIRTVVDKSRSDVSGIIMEDRRGKHGNHSRVDNNIKDGVRHFIKAIPKIESHYCRADTRKEYIDGSKNIAEIYRDYVKQCEEKREASANYTMFNRIFNDNFNIAFYQPKKDQCEDCVAYGNATGEDKNRLKPKYDNHLKEKELSRIEKANDKKKAEDKGSIIVAIYDLQAVMPCPRGDVSNFYYVSKLNTFNFTIYETNNKNALCYVWHEGEANRGATEIGTCVLEYLKSLRRNGTSEDKLDIIFYSDNCCGQQKNKFIISMYMYAVSTLDYISSITHKFLIKGHTQNEGDSVHSVIEKSITKTLKSGPIYTPDQYISIIRTAKKKGPPYKVIEMDHKSFYDIKSLASDVGNNFNKNTDNESVKMTNIKILKVKDDHKGFFFYKTSYDDIEFKCVKVTGRNSKHLDEHYKLKSAYKKRNGISENKKKGLLDLVNKNIVPNYYRQFYEGL